MHARALVSRRCLAALPLLLGWRRAAVSTDTQPAVTVLPAPSRVVAVGDLHGDCAAALRVLRLARLVPEAGQPPSWCGGDAVLVTIGDVLDRGDEEPELLALLRSLKEQAAAVGGAVVTLLGNHEVLNAAGITAFASERGAAAFGESRTAAFRPGGELGQIIASIEQVKSVLSSLVGAIAHLVEGAKAGDFGVRASKEEFEGAYAELIEGVNELA